MADILCVHRLTLPLFRIDPGWLFIAAGVAICAAGVILPAQTDLHALREQTDSLRQEEERAYARLKAHSDFMDQVDRADPALIRRLAATQLNVVPEGDTPVLLAASATVPVTHWIEAAVQLDLRPPKAAPPSALSKLANGPFRLWMFGGGIMFVFVGLLLAPGTGRTMLPMESDAPDALDDDWHDDGQDHHQDEASDHHNADEGEVSIETFAPDALDALDDQDAANQTDSPPFDAKCA